MEKRRFGRTEHQSSVAIFGAAAFYEISQSRADEVLKYVLSTEINHIDIAPGYGDAEDRTGAWLERYRDRYFVGCKTVERSKEKAAAEMRISLEKLRIDQFDLFQFHAVATMDELDQVTADGGALEAIIEAQKEGLTKFIGVTSHGWQTPAVLLEALDRYPFDSVLFPINPNFFTNSEYREKTSELLARCEAEDIGTMIIKAIAKGAWGEGERAYTTWYEPFDTPEEIQRGIDFALTQKVTGICTPADVNLLPLAVQACEQFAPMSVELQENLIENAKAQPPIFKVE